MIYQGSRYEKATLVPVERADGKEENALYMPRGSQQVYDYRSIMLMEGTRLDLLAAQEYSDPTLWWVIARANPELFYPDNITPGTILRIPSARSVR